MQNIAWKQWFVTCYMLRVNIHQTEIGNNRVFKRKNEYESARQKLANSHNSL
jgi:hypothetical protein